MVISAYIAYDIFNIYPDYHIIMSNAKKGALHRQLHIPQDEPVPTGILDKIHDQGVGSHVQSRGHSVPVTPLLKKRAQFARSFR